VLCDYRGWKGEIVTTLYKLTDQNGRTMNGCEWGEGVDSPDGTKFGEESLCIGVHYHAYTDPLIAVLRNPVDENIANPLLWEAEGVIANNGKGLEVGCTRLKTIRQIPLPEISPGATIRWAILCAMEVCANAEFVAWTNDWLSGADRSGARAWASAWASAVVVAWAAAWPAWAAWAAARVSVATVVAEAAAQASIAAEAETDHPIDFAALAHRAVKEENAMEQALK